MAFILLIIIALLTGVRWDFNDVEHIYICWSFVQKYNLQTVKIILFNIKFYEF